MRLTLRLQTVDINALPGNIRRSLRGQKEDRMRLISRCAETPERYADAKNVHIALQLSLASGLSRTGRFCDPRVLPQVCYRSARSNGIHRDVVLGQF